MQMQLQLKKEHLNVERYEELTKLFPNAAFKSAEEKVRELRLIKDEKRTFYFTRSS